MNPLAVALNKQIESSIIGRLLSDMGSRMFFPKGIVAQSSEAAKRADRFNATVGMAYSQKKPMILDSLQRLIPSLASKEAVAYAPTAGQPVLRETWKKMLVEKNPTLKNFNLYLPIVTAGITHGVSVLIDLFANESDTVIIPDMYWGNYRLMLSERRKAKIESFPFYTESDGFNITALDTVLGRHTEKVIVMLNFPNNPTGYSPTLEEASSLTAVLKKHADRGLNMLVILDDAYFGFFYEKEVMTESLFAPLSQAHKNILAVKADGITKEDFAWGLRVGFLTYGSKNMCQEEYEVLEKKTMGAIRSSVSNISNLSQNLMMKVYNDPKYMTEQQEHVRLLQRRYERVRAILADKPTTTLTPLPFNSGYFMAFRIRAGLGEALRNALLEKGIGIIAVNDDIVRISFASVDEDQLAKLYDDIYATAERLS